MNNLLFAITHEGTRQAWDTVETAALVYMGVAIILTILALGWLIDWRRGRAAGAAVLEAQVTDALMNEPDLVWTTVTAVAHVPLWPTTPTTLELRGQVNGAEAREKAVRAALRVLADHPGRVKLEDRLWVDPASLQLAA
jgi:hypothetical protein